MNEQVFTVRFPEGFEYDESVLEQHIEYDYDCKVTVTPAEPSASELLQAWKDDCDKICCNAGGEEKPFPCKCLCNVMNKHWDITEIIKLFNERAR